MYLDPQAIKNRVSELQNLIRDKETVNRLVYSQEPTLLLVSKLEKMLEEQQYDDYMAFQREEGLKRQKTRKFEEAREKLRKLRESRSKNLKDSRTRTVKLRERLTEMKRERVLLRGLVVTRMLETEKEFRLSVFLETKEKLMDKYSGYVDYLIDLKGKLNDSFLETLQNMEGEIAYMRFSVLLEAETEAERIRELRLEALKLSEKAEEEFKAW